MTSNASPNEGNPIRRCAACFGELQEERRVHDDRYGFPGDFALLRCPSCGHRSLDVRMSDAQIAELYTRYYPRSSFDLSAWSPPAESSGFGAWWRGLQANAFRWVPRDVRVLDIGCGFGESLGYHRARGCDAHGVEADANILRVAERHGLQVRHGLFDAAHYAPSSFDVVTLDQVLEHVAEPGRVLRGIHQVLRPGGLLVLSTPNADGWGAKLFRARWIHWHAPYHLQFFSRNSMQHAAEAAGFSLERHVTVTPAAWLDFQWGHLVTYPRRGEPSAYWLPKRHRTTGQRVGLRLLSYLDRLGVNALLTRLADSLRIGDNSVYLFRKQAG